MQTQSAQISRAAELLKNATKVTVLTGAGVSKESGIPTFRDAQTGLWANYDPERLATPGGFQADPSLVWRWYDYRRKMVREVQPNPGHHAIVDLEKAKPGLVVVTQNVDRLHHRAGSSQVIELHGNILTFFCFDRHHPAKEDIAFDLEEPPKCHCGSLMRPAVVWFGEALPAGALDEASQLMMTSDVVLVVGTSGIVQPAASLPFVASRHGAKVIEVNPDRTPISDTADVFVGGPSGQMLPQIVAAMA